MIKPAANTPPNEHASRWASENISDSIQEEEAYECIEKAAAGQVNRLELETATRCFFEAEGPMRNSEIHGGRPYEYRPQQAAMAEKIAEVLAVRSNLCIEAPTGIGKSFAYLIPLIFYAKQSPGPAVISTETINLQEQLVRKDIPLLQKLTGEDFYATLAKGRGNYLCLRRLRLATGERGDEYLPLASLKLEADRIAKWAENTTEGDRDSIDFRVEQTAWNYVCCEAGNCLGPRCQFFRRCFYWKARREWEDADIIVANHALFFTDLKMKGIENAEQSLLPEYTAVVIDEAHTLENNAADYLGLRITSAGMISFLNRLFNPDNAKGLLMRGGEDALELRKMLADLKEQVKRFFSQFEQFLLEQQDSVRRVRNPGSFPDILSKKLETLRVALSDYSQIQDDKDFRAELESQVQKCYSYISGITDFIQMSFDDSVYWVEEDRSGIVLQAAPLNVPEVLREVLFKPSFPVILTSATLTVRKSFDYYRSRVGFINGAELRLDSPFDSNQVRVFLPQNMPEPNHKDYSSALLQQIPRFISITQGKAFVLFTSYQLLRHCADNLRDFFDTNDISLLIQGEELNRSAMLKEFKRDVNSVIFGTDSFWTGVDVPGEALSNVIVTKFPFAVPSHPLIESRCERIEHNGGSSFMHYSLPEAVLKFRQGIGRLIRSKADNGIIVILDRRAVSKRYGKMFIDSLPPYPVQFI
ncbi:helicase C-terminal domain-containing protein [Lentisphaerota bacterium ZTH]|nr:DEAD/DEAH box helicase [Lentisphaerota bacterium]WET05232.1 helicase C-terminal domain-containing protein [Lentisphaerota bacterium ZTH]